MTLKELVDDADDPQVLMEYEGLLTAKNHAIKERDQLLTDLHAARELQWAAERDRANVERSLVQMEQRPIVAEAVQPRDEP